MSVNVYPKGEQLLLFKPNTYTRTWAAWVLFGCYKTFALTLMLQFEPFIQVYHSSLFEKYSKVHLKYNLH